MNEPDVHSILIDRLASSRNITRKEVLDELGSAGVIDSLEGVELVMEAEQVFGITISDRELSSETWRSVPELVALIQSKLNPSLNAKGRVGR